MYPSRNGAGTGRRRMPHAAKAQRGMPIGDAPKSFTRAERKVFAEMRTDIPWLDKTHRKWLVATARTSARVDALSRFFNKRVGDALAAGHSESEAVESAYMNGGEVHPKLTELNAAENAMTDAMKELERHREDVLGRVMPTTAPPPESAAARYFR